MSQCSKLWSVLNSLIKSVLNVSHPLKVGRGGRAILRSIPGHHQLFNLINVIVIIFKDWYIYCHNHFYIDDNGTQVWVLWVEHFVLIPYSGNTCTAVQNENIEKRILFFYYTYCTITYFDLLYLILAGQSLQVLHCTFKPEQKPS